MQSACCCTTPWLATGLHSIGFPLWLKPNRTLVWINRLTNISMGLHPSRKVYVRHALSLQRLSISWMPREGQMNTSLHSACSKTVRTVTLPSATDHQRRFIVSTLFLLLLNCGLLTCHGRFSDSRSFCWISVRSIKCICMHACRGPISVIKKSFETFDYFKIFSNKVIINQ